MIETLKELDIRLFYFINGSHNPFFDKVFWVLSEPFSITIVLILVFLFVSLPKEKKASWMIILCIGLCFLFSDRISVMCFKDVFCRLRPCHALENVRLLTGHCGGQYGFVSSHAANVFSLAVFFSFVYKKKKWLIALLLIWAVLVAYSRVYLGVHYPGDVFCGALLGTGNGSLVFWLYIKCRKFLNAKKKIQSS